MHKRHYQNYSDDKLKECLESIRDGSMSQRKAEEHFCIPRSTIKNKLKGLHANPVGRPNALTNEEEQEIAERLILCADFGFPLERCDLQMTVFNYLQETGKKIDCFQDENWPGKVWTIKFIKRHDLTNKFTSSIKRSRAEIKVGAFEKYFSNLEKELPDIPPENIWNYDESNLVDDVGRKKFIVKKGMKYPERVMNTSKISFSIMFAGNANGDIMPPYVVYKSQHLYHQWTEGGPKGTKYNRTQSGWFDCVTFCDWFFTIALPILRKQEGKKGIIGDNLPSHFNKEVIKACNENNIKFLCLPPNSTHLTQPLDVAYFRPLKVAWRKIVLNWKKSSNDRYATLPKSVFPKLLKNLVANLDENNGSQNLKSGFKKCGIFPLNRFTVLDRLPQVMHSTSAIDKSFIDLLTKMREGENEKKTCKRTKLNIEPGKSVGQPEDSENDIDADDPDEVASSSSEEEQEIRSESSSEDEDINGSSYDQEKSRNFTVNDWVRVKYDKDIFYGEIMQIDKSFPKFPYKISVMHRVGAGWA